MVATIVAKSRDADGSDRTGPFVATPTNREFVVRPSALKLSLAIVGILVTALPALAESNVCANLQSDLASLNRRAPASAYDPYGDALTKQKSALDRAQSDYQRQCAGGLFAQPSPNCPALADRIQAMQTNMQKLQRNAPLYAAKTESPERQRLQALIKQNHCGEPGSAVLSTDDAPKPGMLFAGPSNRTSDPIRPTADASFGRTFTLPGPNGPVTYREEPGGRILALGPATAPAEPIQQQRRSNILTTEPKEDADPDQPDTPDEDMRDGETSGSYRTLCVRTCDGYYFPISYSTSRSQFTSDADFCRARCPGTETRLYAVKTPGEDGEQSFAADTGEPYTKLPNALRYRREVVNACTCGRVDASLMPDASLAEDGGTRVDTRAATDPRPTLPVPDPRPLLGEDPETLADIEQNFTPRPIDPQAAVAATTSAPLRGPMSPRTIRIVGPKFYADR